MTRTLAPLDLDTVRDTLYAEGIFGMPGAFSPEWGAQLHEDCMSLHEEASTYESGRINRGRNRWYFAVHPEQITGVADILTHTWLTAVCEAMLGPD